MEDLKGRLDLVFLRLGEEFCKRIKARTGVDLWEGDPASNQSGLKALTNELIDQCGIPRAPIDIPRTLASLVTGGKIDAGDRQLPKKRRRSVYTLNTERARSDRRDRRV